MLVSLRHATSPVRGCALVLGLTLGGCFQSQPVTARNCAIRAVGTDRVSFEASIRDNTQKIVKVVNVGVKTTGVRPGGGSIVDYELRGWFTPGHWVRAKTVKPVSADPFDLNDHLGTIYECVAHGAEYADGTYWTGFTPDM